MKVKFKIYHLWDNSGNECAIVTDDPNTVISPWGLFDENGNSLYFESEAYHLEKWAADNGLGFAVHEREAEIEKPGTEA